MWKYIVKDKDGKIIYDTFDNVSFKAHEIAYLLEIEGFEVLSLSKISPLEAGAFMIKTKLPEISQEKRVCGERG